MMRHDPGQQNLEAAQECRLARATEDEDHMAYAPVPDSPSVVFPLPVGTCRRTSAFGMRIHPTTRAHSMHPGVDYGAPEGTPILAFAAGRVVDGAPDDPRLGGWIAVAHELGHGHGPVVSLYAHMWPTDMHVSSGQVVRPGQVVGLVGSAGRANGPHLHFELHVGHAKTPTDPERWVDENAPWASAVWRVVPTNGKSRRRELRRRLTRLV